MAEIAIELIQLKAINSIENPNWEAQYRNICRWFSKEFSTPLETVELDLDRFYVLTHYYESSFGQLFDSDVEESNAKYEEIKKQILVGQLPEDQRAELEAEDDNWEAEMQAEILESAKKQEEHKARKVAEAESLKNPNLEEELEFSVQGEDSPPDF